MNSQQVVEAIAMQLAERRAQARARHVAYQALARAIVNGQTQQSTTLYALDSHPTGRGGVAAAA
jgi:hypothetical protein